MFDAIKTRIRDMATLKSLCERAEQHALCDGQREPGAEHFVLAALDLPDGTARLAFERLGADPDAFKSAIARQYDEALVSIGLEAPPRGSDTGAAPARAAIYDAAPSGQDLLKELAAGRKAHRPLLGAHVIAVAADAAHGVTPRALRVMAVDAAQLKAAAEHVTGETRSR